MAKSKNASKHSGFLNVYKPSGMTAHDVVGRVRRITGIRQVGHAGTLDPMATGVLPIAIGKSCRLLRFLQDDKVYRAGILFGQSTDTDDIEGKVVFTSELMPSLGQIEEALPSFIGRISQRPPAYSAIHVDGERLYKLARKGELPAEIPLRQVTVYSIEQLGFTNSVLELRIHCSTGTYIRSIARDLGEKLGTVACLCSLERERAGGFAVEASAELEKLAEADAFVQRLIAPETKIDLPLLELESDEYRRLGFGQIVSLNLSRVQNLGANESNPEEKFCKVMFASKLVAICKLMVQTANECSIKPEVVLDDGRSD